MRPGALIAAACEILADAERAPRPADQTLRQWGRANRFAGSGDRARLADIVFGVWRHRAALTERTASQDPRLLVLAHQVWIAGTPLDEVSAQCDGTGHNAAPLTADERAVLSGLQADRPLTEAAQAGLSDWLFQRIDPRFRSSQAYAAMTARAPLDLRVNTLAMTPDAALPALTDEAARRLGDRAPGIEPCPFSPVGLRLTPRQAGRLPADLNGFDLYASGAVEVQDEGSQIVSLLTGAEPGGRVIDLCAGAGGKTLALAAAMGGAGTILACDTDARRLGAAQARAKRAGAAMIEWAVLDGDGDHGALVPGSADLVVLDVPCSGSGTWRRAPDAPWRLDPAWIDGVRETQAGLLARGAGLVRPGGHLAYITCSILPEENDRQIAAFLTSHAGFERVPGRSAWARACRTLPDAAVFGPTGSVQMGPHLTGTDGFFLAVMRRVA